MQAPATQSFDDWQLTFQTPWSTSAIALAIAVALVAWGLSLWGQRHQPLGRRILLGILRGLSLGAICFLVVQPALQLRNVTRVPNHVVVLLDDSRSMAIRGSGGADRARQARALLAASEGRLESWRTTRRVDFFRFGGRLGALGSRVPGAAELPSRAEATRLRAALEELRQRYRGDDLAGVVVLSDGADNGRFGPQGRGARAFAKGFGAPIHGVLVGARRLRDVAIAGVHADDFAFVRNALKVEADVLAQGIEVGQTLEVVLRRYGGREVARRRVVVQRGKQSYRVAFDFVPQKVGSYVYEVVTAVLPREALKDNNRRRFLLKVIRDRIRVLQVCGRPSWDQRFLRRLLKRDPNIDLISFFILRTPASQSLVPATELSLIPFPTEELFERELGSFDLVILQNFDYGPYGIGIYLPHLRRYVLQGGGLAMLGGDLSFSSGGYAGTPVGQVLPVSLYPRGPADMLIDEADFRPRITAAGRRHPILQLGRDAVETTKLLARLPTFAGVNRVRGLAPGATALLEHPSLDGEQGGKMPVLATREVGKGRTLALTSDSLWHWAFESLGEPGGSRRVYDRFWQATLRWLIRDPELKYLRVLPQRERVRLGREVRVTVRAMRADYKPAAGVSVAWEIESLPASERPALRGEGRTDARGELRLSFTPKVAGPYRVRARARLGGRQSREEALLLVRRRGLEDRDPRARRALLERLAGASGGRLLDDVDSLPDLAFNKPRVLRVNWQKEIDLWGRWWSLLLVVVLLAAEWALRRRLGHL